MTDEVVAVEMGSDFLRLTGCMSLPSLAVLKTAFTHCSYYVIKHNIFTFWGGVKDDEETERRYPRCGELNSVHSDNCSWCNQVLEYKRLMDEVEKKMDMNKEISRFNEQVSHLLRRFEGRYYKDDKLTPICQTEEWQQQLLRIMREHYEGR